MKECVCCFLSALCLPRSVPYRNEGVTLCYRCRKPFARIVFGKPIGSIAGVYRMLRDLPPCRDRKEMEAWIQECLDGTQWDKMQNSCPACQQLDIDSLHKKLGVLGE